MSAHVRVGSITLTLLLPLFFMSLSSPLTVQVQAADACAGDTTPVAWNETVQRTSLVPHHNSMWWSGFYYEDEMERGEMGDSPESSSSSQPGYNAELSPEEPWMYDNYYTPRLEPLEVNHFTTMLIGNDSVGALRVNLSADYRTTVCITLQDTNFNPVNADVYLFTTEQYSNYEESYHSSHDENAWYYNGEVQESLSDIPPEWRSFNFLGWKSYRDSHEYEKTSEVNFALNLDGPEIYTSFFSGTDWQDFYIVIDTWDNVHDFDAEAPDTIVAADITIITTERSLVLPPYTVAIVFLVGFLATLIAPFILNARYMKAGLMVPEQVQSIVPSLDTPAQHPDRWEEVEPVTKQWQEPVPLPDPISMETLHQNSLSEEHPELGDQS
ncbi:MAG: hypothetical protein ISR21_01235 [Candidatus Poseidoniaceae archaeon]|nr:hypothetical protein [Candidatus Poseidoniaceae archaeon]